MKNYRKVVEFIEKQLDNCGVTDYTLHRIRYSNYISETHFPAALMSIKFHQKDNAEKDVALDNIVAFQEQLKVWEKVTYQDYVFVTTKDYTATYNTNQEGWLFNIEVILYEYPQ